jgi:UDP-3-O-[3-hydroxymyristoyl] N-acetylglucosamine deacetylase
MNRRAVSSHHDPCIMQKTLVNPMRCEGIGVHSGAIVTMKILPAAENHGIWFERTDLPSNQEKHIAATWSAVSATQLCTQVSNETGASVATIEHLMAAMAALEIDNALIQIDGPEVPVMDGSSEPFIHLLTKAGIQQQYQPRRALKILKEITVEGTAGQKVSLLPADKFSLEFQMDFAGRQGLGAQNLCFSGVMARMRDEISRARTFGFLEDVEKMRAAGFAKGGSLDNAVVIDQGKVLNEGGLRYPDEFVRHKILDAIGDLYLVGGPILGLYRASNGGHMLNNKLLRTLMADPTAWVWEEAMHKTNGYWQPLNNNLFEPAASFG